MVTWNEVIEKYGEDMASKMKKSVYLQCITVQMNENGEVDIPERDINLAFRDVTGGKIEHWEWD